MKNWLVLVGVVVFCSTALAMGELPTTSEVVTPTMAYTRDYGLPGSGERQFYFPQDVKVPLVGNLETGLGDMFITDTGNNRVERLDRNGGFVSQFGGFGADPGKFNGPTGIAVDFN
jgi:hypothetical protein